MKRLTPIKAIRAKCLECQGGRPSLVRNCESVDCPLYMYRMGKNPARKGIGNLKGFSAKKTQTQVYDSDSKTH